MSTRYRIDAYRRSYFVIESFGQLFETTHPDSTPIYVKLHASPAHAAGDVLESDRMFTRGNREGWAINADT